MGPGGDTRRCERLAVTLLVILAASLFFVTFSPGGVHAQATYIFDSTPDCTNGTLTWSPPPPSPGSCTPSTQPGFQFKFSGSPTLSSPVETGTLVNVTIDAAGQGPFFLVYSFYVNSQFVFGGTIPPPTGWTGSSGCTNPGVFNDTTEMTAPVTISSGDNLTAVISASPTNSASPMVFILCTGYHPLTGFQFASSYTTTYHSTTASTTSPSTTTLTSSATSRTTSSTSTTTSSSTISSALPESSQASGGGFPWLLVVVAVIILVILLGLWLAGALPIGNPPGGKQPPGNPSPEDKVPPASPPDVPGGAAGDAKERKEAHTYEASMHSDATGHTGGCGHAWPNLRDTKTVTVDGQVVSTDVTEYLYDFAPAGNAFYSSGEVVFQEKHTDGSNVSSGGGEGNIYFPITKGGFDAAKAWADSTVTRIGGKAAPNPGSPPSYAVLWYNCVDYTIELCKKAGVDVTDFGQFGPSTPANLVAVIRRKNCKHVWELKTIYHMGTGDGIAPPPTKIWVCKPCGMTKPYGGGQ